MKPVAKITEAALRDTIAQFVFQNPEHIGDTDDFSEDLGLDSIDRLDLLSEVEKRHRVQLSDEQFWSVSNLTELLDALKDGSGHVQN